MRISSRHLHSLLHPTQAFIRANEECGRKDLAAICRRMSSFGKPEEEVARYYKVFWEKCHELEDHEAIVKKIEKGELRLQKSSTQTGLLADMLKPYQNREEALEKVW